METIKQAVVVMKGHHLFDNIRFVLKALSKDETSTFTFNFMGGLEVEEEPNAKGGPSE